MPMEKTVQPAILVKFKELDAVFTIKEQLPDGNLLDKYACLFEQKIWTVGFLLNNLDFPLETTLGFGSQKGNKLKIEFIYKTGNLRGMP